MRERHRTWTAWIVVWAFLLSGVWPQLAFGHDRVPSWGDDVCSASRAGERSAPASPAHTHKHCAECVVGAAAQFAAPAPEHQWATPLLPRATIDPVVREVAAPWRHAGASPRGPPLKV